MVASNTYATGGTLITQINNPMNTTYYHIYTDATISSTFTINTGYTLQEIELYIVGAGTDGSYDGMDGFGAKGGDGGKIFYIDKLSSSKIQSISAIKIGTNADSESNVTTDNIMDNYYSTNTMTPQALGGLALEASGTGNNGEEGQNIYLNNNEKIVLGPGGGSGGSANTNDSNGKNGTGGPYSSSTNGDGGGTTPGKGNNNVTYTLGYGGGGGGSINSGNPGNGGKGVVIIGYMVPNPGSSVCFLEGTPVETDQGEVAIDKLDTKVNTINGKRILAVTETPGEKDCLVIIKKDLLGENKPNKDIIISKWHRVFYDEEMEEACRIPDTELVPYNGEILYNVLMDEHETMKVNGLTVETLDPDHKVAKFYKKNL